MPRTVPVQLPNRDVSTDRIWVVEVSAKSTSRSPLRGYKNVMTRALVKLRHPWRVSCARQAKNNSLKNNFILPPLAPCKRCSTSRHCRQGRHLSRPQCPFLSHSNRNPLHRYSIAFVCLSPLSRTCTRAHPPPLTPGGLGLTQTGAPEPHRLRWTS